MRRSVIAVSGLLTILLCGGLLAGVGSAQTAQTEANTSSGAEEPNASFGAAVSSFMQASEAEAENELDDEMFEATLNRTPTPEERRALLKERQQRLEERNRELRTRREALDGASNARGHAIATRVAIGSDRLEQSVNQTEQAAVEVGMNTTELEAIRSNARKLRGQKVAELARGFAGPPENQPGPPEEAGRGPPEKASNENRSPGSQPTGEGSSDSMPPIQPTDRPDSRDSRTSGPDRGVSDGREASDDIERPSAKPNGVDAGGASRSPAESSPGNNRGSADDKSNNRGSADDNGGSSPPETNGDDSDTRGNLPSKAPANASRSSNEQNPGQPEI
jgi:hypothetical protein